MTVQTFTINIGVNDYYPGTDQFRYFPPLGTNIVPSVLSTSVTITVTSITSTTGGFIDLLFYDQHGSTILNLPSAGVGSTGTVGWSGLINGYLRAQYVGPINDTNNTFILTIDDHAGPPIYCEYGTEKQSGTGANLLYFLTPALIDAVLASMGIVGDVAAALFTSLWFTYLDIGALCSKQPPLWPQLTAADLSPPNIPKLQQALAYIAWPYFCQCTAAPPGSPAPTPPPTPAPDLPTGVQPPVAFACDGADVCGLLNQLALAIGNINAIIGQNLNLTTLIQRQRVPFAYVPGTLHSALSGNGQFAVQGILGVAVRLTTLPGRLGEESGDPTAYFEAGYVTTGTPDGWRRSVPLRHNPLWVDVEPDDTLVGYSLTPGVVADIQELKREP